MTRRTGAMPPFACAEALVRHPDLPAGADSIPAVLHAGPLRQEWIFRPSVLAALFDILPGSGGSARRTGYRLDPVAGTALLFPPDSFPVAARFVSDDLPFCPPPPKINRALDPEGWTLADRQPPVADWTADACLAVLAAPDRNTVEEAYVRADPGVERLPAAALTRVAALWTVPARDAELIVPAGLVALYDPETRAQSAAPDDDQDWLPDCPRCGEPLIDSGSVPGMYYPWPDLGPADSPWCPKHPLTDRPRPHAAHWRPVRS
ncbi:hypothetical protein [Amycolatopsis sp. NPDC004079]|uniref:hypothetical protein n=1 Tax=Amycolatopsis sp. NPDC004079 TaxID=3154549 RepID=UPI0033A50314